MPIESARNKQIRDAPCGGCAGGTRHFVIIPWNRFFSSSAYATASLAKLPVPTAAAAAAAAAVASAD
jgi:hypothetical protein